MTDHSGDENENDAGDGQPQVSQKSNGDNQNKQAQRSPGKDDNRQNQDQQNKSNTSNQENKPAKTPIYKRPIAVAIAIVVLLVLIIGGVFYWLYARSHETTDDAFVDGNSIQIAPQISGRVTALLVTDNQDVQAGQPLIEIDPRDYQAKLDQANGQLANAKAQLMSARAQATSAAADIAVQQANVDQSAANVRVSDAERVNAAQDLARYRAIDKRAISEQQVDSAIATARSKTAQLDATRQAFNGTKAQLNAKRAQLAQAEAQIETAAAGVTTAEAEVEQDVLQLSYCHVVAPGPGHITNRTVDVGNYVAAGQAMMAIISPNLWVTANYKETQLTHMRPGQAAMIKLDSYPGVKFHAHVDSIARGTGAYFSLLPSENATGNYVKVVQRLPVKLIFDDDKTQQYLLAPGMSVVPTVTVK